MAQFVPGTPVVTREPVVTVDAGLRPGRYVFQLVVVDDQEQQSAPDQRIVTITFTRPVPPITGPVIGPGTPVITRTGVIP